MLKEAKNAKKHYLGSITFFSIAFLLVLRKYSESALDISWPTPSVIFFSFNDIALGKVNYFISFCQEKKTHKQ